MVIITKKLENVGEILCSRKSNHFDENIFQKLFHFSCIFNSLYLFNLAKSEKIIEEKSVEVSSYIQAFDTI